MLFYGSTLETGRIRKLKMERFFVVEKKANGKKQRLIFL